MWIVPFLFLDYEIKAISFRSELKMQIPPEINYITQADSSLLLQMTGSWILDGDIPDSGPEG